MFGLRDRQQCDCMNYQMFSFYDNYGGSDEEVNSICKEQSILPLIVMSLKEGAKYTGVPEKELQRLINERKINGLKSNMGMIVHYTDMKSVKYWWEKYQEGKKETKWL